MGHYQELISKSAFSSRAGVSPAAITKACQKGGRLNDALGPAGKIDANHPAATLYISDQIKKSKGKPGQANKKPSKVGRSAAKEDKKEQASQRSSAFNPDLILEYEDMTLREIVEQHGTDVQFLDWVKAAKEIISIEEKRIKIKKQKQELLPTEVFEKVISTFEEAHMKILNENKVTISLEAHQNQQAGYDVSKTEELFEKIVGSTISSAKKKLVRWMKDLEDGKIK